MIGKRLTYRSVNAVKMQSEGNVTLTIHGLAADNGLVRLVRADVFLEKFRALLNSLKVADKYLNGKKSHNIVITDLKNGSATAAAREKVSVKKRVPVFGAPFVAEALNAVYNGDRDLDRSPQELIESCRSWQVDFDGRRESDRLYFQT